MDVNELKDIAQRLCDYDNSEGFEILAAQYEKQDNCWDLRIRNIKNNKGAEDESNE